MNLGLLRVGPVSTEILEEIRRGLNHTFPRTKCLIIDEDLRLSERAYDTKRKQYRSEAILRNIQLYALNRKDFDRILGVVDADIFVPSLNFVFGEAAFPGKVALISLWRLKPEFYGAPANKELFTERSLKEATHEIGHTLGLKHCTHPSCVMYFSNSITDTDRKQSIFCEPCVTEVTFALSQIGDFN